MRLLIDSALAEDWQAWLPAGLVYGVTTNPTLLKRAGLACELPVLTRLTAQALGFGAQEVHLQAWGGNATAFYDCGSRLAALAPGRVLVKLPITRAGCAAAARLIAAGQRVTFTACYDASQMLIASALGADYAAPYLGRIGDGGRDGHAELLLMQRALDGVASSTRLLAASLRQVADVSRLAAAGISHFTLSAGVLSALFEQPETLAAAAQFEADAAG
jgi:transaldolase